MMRENAHSTMTISRPDRQSRVSFGGKKNLNFNLNGDLNG